MNAIIICRVSSDRQEDGYSLGAQLDLMQEYCRKKGLIILREFHMAESAAKHKQRKKFMEAIDYALVHNIPHIVLEKTDRATRNFTDLETMLDLSESRELSFHFPKEGQIIHKEMTAHEKMVLGFKVLLARSFIDNLREETKKGMKKKAESGGWATRAPYGYAMDKDGELVIDLTKSEYMRKMFDEYRDGKSVNAIASFLNSLGAPPPRGKMWHGSAIHRMLQNPVYYGDIKFKSKVYQGRHEGIITKDEWLLTQDKLKSNKVRPSRQSHPLTGLLWYENGRAMSPEHHKGHTYYVIKLFEGRTGKRTSLREDRAFEIINEEVKKIKWSKEFSDTVLYACQEFVKETSTGNEEQINKYQSIAQKAREKKARMLDLYATGDLDRETYLKKELEFRLEEEQAEKALQIEKHGNARLLEVVSIAVQTLRDLPAVYSESSKTGKGQILKSLCEKITIDEQKKAALVFRQPFIEFISDNLKPYFNLEVRNRAVLRPLWDVFRKMKSELIFPMAA